MRTNPKTTASATRQTFERIAREHLSLDTLETRNSGRLDFTEQAVWQIAKALEAAYEAGRASAPPPATTTNTTPRSKS